MRDFKNGDVLRNKNDYNDEVTFIGMAFSADWFVGKRCNDINYREYHLESWELKPKTVLRWIAVWPDGSVYNEHYVSKEIVQGWVNRECTPKYVESAQYIQIEVEV